MRAVLRQGDRDILPPQAAALTAKEEAAKDHETWKGEAFSMAENGLRAPHALGA
jgi:hypothetical protein